MASSSPRIMATFIATMMTWALMTRTGGTARHIVTIIATIVTWALMTHTGGADFVQIQSIFPDFEHCGVAVRLDIPDAMGHANTLAGIVEKFIANHQNKSDISDRFIKSLQMQVQSLRRTESNLDTLIAFQIHSLKQPTRTDNIRGQRKKRGLNIDINAASIVTAVFNGVTSLFHGHSIAQLKSGIKHLAAKFSRQAEQQSQINLALFKHIAEMKEMTAKHIDFLSWMSLAGQAMTQSQKEMMSIIESILPLSKGSTPPAIIDHTLAKKTLQRVKTMAMTKGYTPLISAPTDIFVCPTSTFTYKTTQGQTDIVIVLSVPMAKPQQKYQGYEFFNLPHLQDQRPMKWDLPEDRIIVGIQEGLYPSIHSLQMTPSQVTDRCVAFKTNLLCHTPTRKTANVCPTSLRFNDSAPCTLTDASTYLTPLWVGHTLILFAAEPIMVYRACEGHAPTTTKRSGLIVLHNSNRCKTIFGDQTIYPHSSTEDNDIRLNITNPNQWPRDSGQLQTKTFRQLKQIEASERLKKAMDDTIQAEKNMAKQLDNDKALFHSPEDKILLTTTSIIIMTILLMLAAFAALAYKFGTGAYDNWWPFNGQPPPAAADDQPPLDAPAAAAA